MVIFKKLNNSNALVEWQESESDPYKQNPFTTLDKIYALYPEGFQFNPNFHKRRFTGYDVRVHMFKMLPSTIPLGLVREAASTLRDYGWEVKVDSEIVESFIERGDYSEYIESFCNSIFKACGLNPRDYQRKILELALKFKRASFRAATGAGKSLAIYMIIRFFMRFFGENTRFLVLVPNKDLVNQLHQNFKDDYNWAKLDDYVGLFHSDYTAKEKNIALNKRILVSTWQSMGSLLEFKKNVDYFKRFNCLIVDELHTAKNDQAVINRVVGACINAEYRFGLTGTIPRNKLNQKVIIGNIGDINHIISSKELIDRGELSKATIIEVQIPYDQYTIDLCRKKKVKLAEEYEMARMTGAAEYAVGSLLRDKIITTDQNTLILMKNVANGEVDNMVDFLKANYPEYEVRKVHGKIKVAERAEIRLGVEGKTGVIIVATYRTFGTGINMKNLHNVIFASSCKSYTLILQSIGRSLRLHKSKAMARIFDLRHMITETKFSKRAQRDVTYHGNLSRHFTEREEFYYEEDYPQEVHVIDRTFSFKDIKLEDLNGFNLDEAEDKEVNIDDW